MIKICGESLTVALRIIFEQSLKEVRFPEIFKKANVVPVHKKKDKNLLQIILQLAYLPSLVKFLRG